MGVIRLFFLFFFEGSGKKEHCFGIQFWQCVASALAFGSVVKFMRNQAAEKCFNSIAPAKAPAGWLLLSD